VVEVNSETDFVARNERFQNAARAIAQAALNVEGGVEQLGQATVGGGETVQDHLTNLIATIGENMVARRMARFQVSQGVVAAYTHNAVARRPRQDRRAGGHRRRRATRPLSELAARSRCTWAASTAVAVTETSTRRRWSASATSHETGRETGGPQNMTKKVGAGRAPSSEEVVL
jgi:translation elongation factor EF-Ts